MPWREKKLGSMGTIASEPLSCIECEQSDAGRAINNDVVVWVPDFGKRL